MARRRSTSEALGSTSTSVYPLEPGEKIAF